MKTARITPSNSTLAINTNSGIVDVAWALQEPRFRLLDTLCVRRNNGPWLLLDTRDIDPDGRLWQALVDRGLDAIIPMAQAVDIVGVAREQASEFAGYGLEVAR